MAEVEEQEGREERKKEPPRPDLQPLEPRWTFGRLGRGDKNEDTNKKKSEEEGK